MQRSDVTVEVRDVNLNRKGIITTKFLDLKAKIEHNKPGSWTLTLPANHPRVADLEAEGSGIVVSLYGQEHFSGVTDMPVRKADRQNPDGTLTFSGVTDDILLADARAWPEPSNPNPGTQANTNDTRTGTAEDVMIAYVARNIGQLAPAARRGLLASKLSTGVSLGRGAIVTKSPRFQNLHELLGEIATYANLGYQVIQRAGTLHFEVLNVTDRSGTVRLDIQNGTLTSEEIAKSPPSLTRAIVAGQGEGTDRLIIQRTTAASAAAEAAWGRVIESFIDQRNSADLVELQQAGDEALLEGGFTATNVKVVPSDDQTMRYAIDWFAGDKVGVIVRGQETKATVTAAVLIVNASTCIVGAAIGDVTGFKASSALTKRVEDTEQRVEKIERTYELAATAVDWVDITGKPVTFPATAQLIAAKAATALPSTYPLGLSIHTVAAPDVSWPVATAIVETERYAANRTTQTLTVKTTGVQMVRSEGDGDTWGAWVTTASMADLATRDTTIAANSSLLLEWVAERPKKVTFANQTVVTIPCTGFDEYEVEWNCTIAGSSLVMQIGIGGVRQTGALYDSNNVFAGGTNATPTSGGDMQELQTSWHLSPATSGTRDRLWGKASVMGLNPTTERPMMNGLLASTIDAATSSSNNSIAVAAVSGRHRTSLAAGDTLYLTTNASTANALTGYYVLTKKKYQ